MGSAESIHDENIAQGGILTGQSFIIGFFADLSPGIVGDVIGMSAGILRIMAALYMCLGDPIVYFLNRAFPALFNVADLNFFNFRPMIFITYPD